MTKTEAPPPEAPCVPPRARWGAAVGLMLAGLAVGALLAFFTYGFASYYADPASPWARAVGEAFLWAGLVVVAGLVAGAVAVVRRSRGRALWPVAVAVLFVAPVAGLAGGDLLGAQARYDALDQRPFCRAGNVRGPIGPTISTAHASLAELEHPGRFEITSAGPEGCAAQLLPESDGDDVPGSYWSTLAEHGWRIETDQRDRVTATRGEQGFEVSRRSGSWWVWAGPAGTDWDQLRLRL